MYPSWTLSGAEDALADLVVEIVGQPLEEVGRSSLLPASTSSTRIDSGKTAAASIPRLATAILRILISSCLALGPYLPVRSGMP